jgi:hypothetical protein
MNCAPYKKPKNSVNITGSAKFVFIKDDKIAIKGFFKSNDLVLKNMGMYPALLNMPLNFPVKFPQLRVSLKNIFCDLPQLRTLFRNIQETFRSCGFSFKNKAFFISCRFYLEAFGRLSSFEDFIPKLSRGFNELLTKQNKYNKNIKN